MHKDNPLINILNKLIFFFKKFKKTKKKVKIDQKLGKEITRTGLGQRISTV